MLAWFSILVGQIFLVGSIFVLFLLLFRPVQWIRFTELEHHFWVRRGFSVKWADAIKKGEQKVASRGGNGPLYHAQKKTKIRKGEKNSLFSLK